MGDGWVGGIEQQIYSYTEPAPVALGPRSNLYRCYFCGAKPGTIDLRAVGSHSGHELKMAAFIRRSNRPRHDQTAHTLVMGCIGEYVCHIRLSSQLSLAEHK